MGNDPSISLSIRPSACEEHPSPLDSSSVPALCSKALSFSGDPNGALTCQSFPMVLSADNNLPFPQIKY